MSITYVSASQVSLELEKDLQELLPKIFNSFNEERFFNKFSEHENFLLLMAYQDKNLVGFKFGYNITSELFYSWMGGVLPSMRGRGIAKNLMDRQHQWCRDNNFKTIETKSKKIFPEMISLNLKAGFEIIGTVEDEKILFRKSF